MSLEQDGREYLPEETPDNYERVSSDFGETSNCFSGQSSKEISNNSIQIQKSEGIFGHFFKDIQNKNKKNAKGNNTLNTVYTDYYPPPTLQY